MYVYPRFTRINHRKDNQLLMTEEIKQQLVDIKILVEFKQRFTAPEQAFIYHVYNKITGEDKRPNGCGACLNNTIGRLKKEIRNAGI